MPSSVREVSWDISVSYVCPDSKIFGAVHLNGVPNVFADIQIDVITFEKSLPCPKQILLLTFLGLVFMGSSNAVWIFGQQVLKLGKVSFIHSIM